MTWPTDRRSQMYTGMNHFLTESEWRHASFMWRAKQSDTATIAKYFNCPEPLIYRELPFYRQKYAGIAEVAA